MAVTVLAGSTAKYVGNDKNWEHRKNEVCTVSKDTRTSSPTYPVRFEGEDKVVHATYESLEFIDKILDY